MEQHRRPDADGVAIDGRDQRLFGEGQESQKPQNVTAKIAGSLRRRQKISEVVAGGERSVRTDEDVGSNSAVGIAGLEASQSAAYISPVNAFFFSGLAKRMSCAPSRRETSTPVLMRTPDHARRRARSPRLAPPPRRAPTPP